MLKEIIGIAQEAGEATLEIYNDSQDVEISRKDDDSPLTKADLASHHIIVDALKELDPDTPIISEESGVPAYEERKGWNTFWIVDPLDGTKEFIKKNGEFTVNIALIDDGVPVLGVVYVPDKETLYYAEKGKGAFKQVGSKAQERIISKASKASDELIAMQSRSHGSGKLVEQLKEKGLNVVETIPAGSSLKFCMVAEGEADIYPRMGPTMEWDVAAGDAVYRYSTKEGVHTSPLTYNKENLKNGSFIVGLKDQSVKF
ncbi:3'(2'),5'-bisphosphate nucleotidase CysQ [Fodinibius halophilus]|uniref:3'(2'),5'-bisphosphate nucleotidase CysQ n=1 Tax=Fodinibius halophilus TaxID=1736908 RepID=A0A6M1T1E5_9BACT|nr:3'(2'),5'-bisphosphate nucleotidase CysQ [Fodinibius halophilus]NGP87799.1 3'(2'),5'-bisphosphate nucleotidase CysQ [Fodinibius halophilus]